MRAGQHEQFEILMRRYNQRLYRVARSIVRDEAEAEDVMQQAYVNAYTHLDQFGSGRVSRPGSPASRCTRRSAVFDGADASGRST